MTYLLRSKSYAKKEPSKNAKKVYLICEGSRNEVRYFNYFQNFSSNLEIITIPSENGKTDPLKLLEKAKDLFIGNSLKNIVPTYNLKEEYEDVVWFIIDTDEWNTGNKIEQLKEFCTQFETSYNAWNVAQSNPSFEQWQYYHFFDKAPLNREVEECKSFKEFVNKKISGGFDNRKHPIDIEIATKNSKDTFESFENQPKIYTTEIYILGELILSFIGEDLLKAKKMNEGK